MKRCIVPWLFAMLLLLTACSRSGGSAEDPIKGPNPTPAAQGHALPKENRSAAGSGEVFTDDDGWYICSAGAVSYYDYTSGRTMTRAPSRAAPTGTPAARRGWGMSTASPFWTGCSTPPSMTRAAAHSWCAKSCPAGKSPSWSSGTTQIIISTPPPCAVSPAARPPCMCNAASQRRAGGRAGR